MKHFIYILLLPILCLMSCQSEEVTSQNAKGMLDLTLQRGPVPAVSTRAVAEGLAVTLLNPDGTVYKEYSAGNVPSKIELTADVEYTLRVYSPNQSTWQTANDGKGEACYFGETTVTVGEDEIVYVTYSVPMANYAVTLTLPELFNDLFKSYTFSLSSGGRNVTLQEGEKAYFAVPDAFSYKLAATNNDDKTSQHSAIEYPDVEAGKLYNIKYVYGTSLNAGGVDIEITDNTEHEDVDVKV